MTETKVDHPEFGHVTFTNLTPRQLDIIEGYEQIIQDTAIECVCEQPNECQKCPHVEVSEDSMSGSCMRRKKMYNREEVISLARDAFDDSCKYNSFKEWIKENLL